MNDKPTEQANRQFKEMKEKYCAPTPKHPTPSDIQNEVSMLENNAEHGNKTLSHYRNIIDGYTALYEENQRILQERDERLTKVMKLEAELAEWKAECEELSKPCPHCTELAKQAKLVAEAKDMLENAEYHPKYFRDSQGKFDCECQRCLWLKDAGGFSK